MDSEGAILVLRLLHIVAGVFWVGAAITVTFFTMPVVRATGAVGGEFWGQFMARSHFSQVMTAAAVVTVGSGLLLYWDFYSGIAWQLADPGPQTIFGLGGLIAIVVALVANLAFPRIGRRLGQIAELIQMQGAPSPAQAAERTRLARRMQVLSTMTAVLLVVTTALMAVGRYA
ncbi:hypothetical protein [Bauldia litoralis]|uniref:Copper resistance protein D n=1 Tax=Bauldia litoralis TaxID=665467 RepID=A0A1G6DHT5_9HYPH|nr:hypothetical protein [Bauldia litoralis]SDB44698.1 hypothetical protein SAMN02982931_03413 [Bauldia litoralis]